jgi:hypothetical protein
MEPEWADGPFTPRGTHHQGHLPPAPPPSPASGIDPGCHSAASAHAQQLGGAGSSSGQQGRKTVAGSGKAPIDGSSGSERVRQDPPRCVCVAAVVVGGSAAPRPAPTCGTLLFTCAVPRARRCPSHRRTAPTRCLSVPTGCTRTTGGVNPRCVQLRGGGAPRAQCAPTVVAVGGRRRCSVVPGLCTPFIGLLCPCMCLPLGAVD